MRRGAACVRYICNACESERARQRNAQSRNHKSPPLGDSCGAPYVARSTSPEALIIVLEDNPYPVCIRRPSSSWLLAQTPRGTTTTTCRQRRSLWPILFIPHSASGVFGLQQARTNISIVERDIDTGVMQ